MEYLNKITDKAKSIDENQYKWINVFDFPEIIYGFPFVSMGNYTGFQKYNDNPRKEIEELYPDLIKQYNNFSSQSSGGFLKFKTASKKIVIKCELKRKYDYMKMTLWNSSGFDVYEVKNGKYIHKTVFAPKSGKSIFCNRFAHDPEAEALIFLPNYNEILNLYIGSEDDIVPVSSVNRPAIAFYGNSITQGCAASRSGNCFANIVSRSLDNEVYNFSMSSCCKGLLSIADMIGMLNLRALIIDFSRNAESLEELEKNYLPFYKRIRKYHSNIPVILLTTSNFTEHRIFSRFDNVIIGTYNYAKENNHNTFLIDQMNLIEKDCYDLCSVDGCHYNEMGMYRVADEIVRIIKEAEQSNPLK